MMEYQLIFPSSSGGFKVQSRVYTAATPFRYLLTLETESKDSKYSGNLKLTSNKDCKYSGNLKLTSNKDCKYSGNLKLTSNTDCKQW